MYVYVCVIYSWPKLYLNIRKLFMQILIIAMCCSVLQTDFAHFPLTINYLPSKYNAIHIAK